MWLPRGFSSTVSLVKEFFFDNNIERGYRYLYLFAASDTCSYTPQPDTPVEMNKF